MTNLENDQITLSHKMLPDLANLILKIKPENVNIKAIQDYDAEFNNFDHITAQDFDTLGMKTIHAMDIAIDWFYVASRFAKYAHTQYDKKAANLYIEVVPNKMAAQGVKDTDAGRNRFLDQESDFVNYKEIRDSWQVFADWLDKKRDSFLQKHMYIKKMIDIRMSERS